MKSAPAALIAHINNSQQFRMADLYNISMNNGTQLYYTSWDTNVLDNGNTYIANTLQIDRSKVRVVLGVEVDTLELKINPHPEDLVNSASFLSVCASGLMDGAFLTMRRAFFDDNGQSLGSYINFSGRIADMNMTRSEVNMTINSDLELLNVQLPRNLYQTTCLHTLYDSDCGLNRATFGVGATVSSSTKNIVGCGLTNPSGYFDLGYVLWSTGALAGIRRTIKSYIPGVVTLLNPLPVAPLSGDTFTAYPGCDKSQSTCTNKFSNVINFRGFPYVPVPETTR